MKTLRQRQDGEPSQDQIKEKVKKLVSTNMTERLSVLMIDNIMKDADTGDLKDVEDTMEIYAMQAQGDDTLYAMKKDNLMGFYRESIKSKLKFDETAENKRQSIIQKPDVALDMQLDGQGKISQTAKKKQEQQ